MYYRLQTVSQTHRQTDRQTGRQRRSILRKTAALFITLSCVCCRCCPQSQRSLQDTLQHQLGHQFIVYYCPFCLLKFDPELSSSLHSLLRSRLVRLLPSGRMQVTTVSPSEPEPVLTQCLWAHSTDLLSRLLCLYDTMCPLFND